MHKKLCITDTAGTNVIVQCGEGSAVWNFHLFHTVLWGSFRGCVFFEGDDTMENSTFAWDNVAGMTVALL